MTGALPLLRLLAKGNAKAVTGALVAFCLVLAGTAEDGVTLAEILYAAAAALGVGTGVRQVPNRGSKANATGVPLIGGVASIDAIHAALAQALGPDVHLEFDEDGYGRIVLGPRPDDEETEPA